MTDIMMWIWLGLFVFFLILEAITQDYVSIWFSAGSLVAICISGFTPYYVQIIVFSIVTIVTLAFTRPVILRLTARTERKTNTDDFVGKRVIAEAEISKFASGFIKLNGVEYQAILLEEETKPIPKGNIVEIVAIKGNKIVVKNIEE